MKFLFRRWGGTIVLLAIWTAVLVPAVSIAESAGNLDLVRTVMQLVEKQYIVPVTSDQLVSGALKGMLANLDPHSSYMDENEFQQLTNDTRGQFGGIGIQIAPRNGAPTIIAPIDGTPAAHAGVEPGDVITQIDGLSTGGMDFEDIVGHIRGVVGSTVKLQIARQGQAPFDVVLTRAVIHVDSVTSHLEKNHVGYIRISTFMEKTPDDLATALKQLKRRAGGRLAGLVLDLRNDPGGLLDSAVSVTGDFLDGGVVVSTRGRETKDDHSYDAPGNGDLIPGTPMVVLINGASASASEIVAGALQDHHRAVIMGTRSFGKGSVQTIIPLDGHGALRLTTARYYTPSGRSIQDLGVSPDVVASLPKDEQVANVLLTHEADLPGSLRNTGTESQAQQGTAPTGGTPSAAAAPADEAPIKPAIIGTDRDAQLSAALKYVQGMSSTARAAASPR